MKKIFKRTIAATLAVTMFAGSVPAFAKEAETPETLKIGTMSDTHYFSSDLYGDNEDFTTALNSDRKMFQESGAILDSALSEMVADKPDVVLISGDLTKDGEQVNHEAVADKLEKAKEALAKEGVHTQFYVINGNHDINNPHGKDYSSGQAVDADRTTVEEFRTIYKDFGYGEGSEFYAPESNRGGSLSYVTRPKDGYTLIVVDSGKYSSDQTASGQDLQETGGVISEELLNWVTTKAKEAKQQGDTVMVMQHHGVIPHFTQEPTLMADYLVDNYQEVQQAYADAGVSYVFTGHMHANDIATYTSPAGNTLYDIETGSLVTYPSPTRRIELTGGTLDNNLSSTMNVQTKLVKSIDYIDKDTGKPIDDLTAYGKARTMNAEVVKTMINEQLLGPMLENTLANGGSKALVGQLLNVPEGTDVSDYLIQMLIGMLPTDKDNGLQLSFSSFNFSIYYDASVGQIKISQVESEKISTFSNQEEGILIIPTEDGKNIRVTLPEELLNALKEALETQPQTMALTSPIEFYIDTATLDETLFNPLFTNIDEQILADPQGVKTVVSKLLETLLAYPVDETHSIMDLVDYVYQTHLAGEETCEDWALTAIDAIQNTDLLKNAVQEAITAALPDAETLLAKVPVDLKAVLQKGNTNFMTSLAYNLITSMIKDGSDVLGLVDLITLIPDSLYEQLDQLAYTVADSMVNDTNYPQDNNTSIRIERTLSEIMIDGQRILEEAKAISKGNYTDASWEQLQTAIADLENALAQQDKAAIQTAITGVKNAMGQLVLNDDNTTDGTTDNTTDESDKTPSEELNETGNVNTGIEGSIAMGAILLIAAAGLFIYKRQTDK